MIDLYRTCMRMARADYCGDGRPYTKNGMSIDLYDRVGIQKPEAETKLSFEAAWGPQGALCIRHIRVPENGSLEDVVRSCPRLATAPTGDQCTEAMPGALMFNKSM